MNWLDWLRGLLRKPPGRVTHIRVWITDMKEIAAEWALPTIREDGSAMPPTEIAYTEALLSTDGGKTYAVLTQVKPDVPQTVKRAPAPDGNYVLRLVAVGTNGKRGKPVDTPVLVDTPAPGLVTAVKVAVT
jgi:hypothetical protein